MSIDRYWKQYGRQSQIYRWKLSVLGAGLGECQEESAPFHAARKMYKWDLPKFNFDWNSVGSSLARGRDLAAISHVITSCVMTQQNVYWWKSWGLAFQLQGNSIFFNKHDFFLLLIARPLYLDNACRRESICNKYCELECYIQHLSCFSPHTDVMHL